MIVSTSRRTDLPAYYTPWLLRRLEEGYALVRNPRSPHSVRRVDLSPAMVDGLVLWTKNPLPLLPHLDQLSSYPYYFQFTLTGYGPDVEPSLPGKEEALIPAFEALARTAGKERVVWRYDPIFFSPRYTPAWHQACFSALAQRLHPWVDQCVVSFIDDYRCMRGRMQALSPLPFTSEAQWALMEGFSQTARRFGLRLATCAEEIDFHSLGVERACCIDRERLEHLGGFSLHVSKAAHQRPACGCAESVDLGAYDTCPAGCRYCYADHSSRGAAHALLQHDPASPLLIGRLTPLDTVKESPARSHRDGQITLF